MTFEQYIEDHASSSMRAYLTGYADAIHNNAYFFGSCPKRFQYRPYNEYMQHIDIYIAQKTKENNIKTEIFLQKSVEPFLTEVILKYIDCSNPEAIQIQDQPKDIQVEVRDVATDIMQKTKKYQTVDEREMEFQYNEYLNRLKNPPKVVKKAKNVEVKKKEVESNISKPIAEKLREQSDKKVVEVKSEDVKSDDSESVIDGVKGIAKGLFAKFTPSGDNDKTENVVKSVKKREEVVSTPPHSTAKPSPNTQNEHVKSEAIKPVETTENVQQMPQNNKHAMDLAVPELKITKGSGNGGAKADGGKSPELTPKQEYKLDALDINLDTLDNAKLPSI